MEEKRSASYYWDIGEKPLPSPGSARCICDVRPIGGDAGHISDIQLLGHSYVGQLVNVLGQLTVAQRYRNVGDNALSVACCLTLQQGEALVDFSTCVDGQWLKRRVVKADETTQEGREVTRKSTQLPSGKHGRYTRPWRQDSQGLMRGNAILPQTHASGQFFL